MTMDKSNITVTMSWDEKSQAAMDELNAQIRELRGLFAPLSGVTPLTREQSAEILRAATGDDTAVTAASIRSLLRTIKKLREQLDAVPVDAAASDKEDTDI